MNENHYAFNKGLWASSSIMTLLLTFINVHSLMGVSFFNVVMMEMIFFLNSICNALFFHLMSCKIICTLLFFFLSIPFHLLLQAVLSWDHLVSTVVTISHSAQMYGPGRKMTRRPVWLARSKKCSRSRSPVKLRTPGAASWKFQGTYLCGEKDALNKKEHAWWR